MDRFFEEDAGGATYRSGDPIKNLRLNIKLQRVSPAILGFLASQPATPGAGGDGGPTLSVSATSVNEYGQTILEEETLECNWQNKFFSPREFEFYANSPISGSVQDYKYHSDVQKLKKTEGRQNTRLFTYCDEDAFAPPSNKFFPMTNSFDEVPTNLATNVAGLRRRKPASSGGNALSSKLKTGQGAPGLQIVVEKPSEEFQQNNHITTTPVHRMLIMADLSPEGQLGTTDFETLLCEIEYDENGVLRITPDFSRAKLPYRAETTLSRDIWLYNINSASTNMSRMEIQKEAMMLKQLYSKHQNYLTQIVGSEFEEVQSEVLRLVINGEIASAQSFEYDDLHVEYLLDLPRNWSCSANDMLSGCTQTCQTKLEENIEVAYFSHPFSFDTYLACGREDSGDYPREYPKIYLQVVSSDTWGRHRTEGYGYITLPSVAGIHTLKVLCWRPIGNAGQEAVVNEMRRFFIGSSPELEDATYMAIPSTFEGNMLNKYGVRTESTGSVILHVNCLSQRQPEAAKPDVVTDHIRRRKQQTALQLAKGKASNEAIHNVMDSFLRARKRMQAARESVPEHIRQTAEARSKQAATGDRADRLSSVLAGEAIWRTEDDSGFDKETTA